MLVVTVDAQLEGMGDVGSAGYEPALLPPCPTIRVLKPQAESLLFAAVLLLLQPIQTEVVDPVFQIVGLSYSNY